MNPSHVLAQKLSNTIKAEDSANLRVGLKENLFRISYPLDNGETLIFMVTCGDNSVVKVEIFKGKEKYATLNHNFTYQQWKDLLSLVYVTYVAHYKKGEYDKVYTQTFLKSNPINQLPIQYENPSDPIVVRMKEMISDMELQKRSTSFNNGQIEPNETYKERNPMNAPAKLGSGTPKQPNGLNSGEITKQHIVKEGVVSIDIPSSILMSLRSTYPQYATLADKELVMFLMGILINSNNSIIKPPPQNGQTNSVHSISNNSIAGSEALRVVSDDFRVRD